MAASLRSSPSRASPGSGPKMDPDQSTFADDLPRSKKWYQSSSNPFDPALDPAQIQIWTGVYIPRLYTAFHFSYTPLSIFLPPRPHTLVFPSHSSHLCLLHLTLLSLRHPHTPHFPPSHRSHLCLFPGRCRLLHLQLKGLHLGLEGCHPAQGGGERRRKKGSARARAGESLREGTGGISPCWMGEEGGGEGEATGTGCSLPASAKLPRLAPPPHSLSEATRTWLSLRAAAWRHWSASAPVCGEGWHTLHSGIMAAYLVDVSHMRTSVYECPHLIDSTPALSLIDPCSRLLPTVPTAPPAPCLFDLTQHSTAPAS